MPKSVQQLLDDFNTKLQDTATKIGTAGRYATGARVLTAEEAATEFNIDLPDSDYLLKINPTDTGYDVSYLTGSNWEITGDKIVSPEGKSYTFDEYNTMMTTGQGVTNKGQIDVTNWGDADYLNFQGQIQGNSELALAFANAGGGEAGVRAVEAAQAKGFVDWQANLQQNYPELWDVYVNAGGGQAGIIAVQAQQASQIDTTFGNVFTDSELKSAVQLAYENPQEFIRQIRVMGRSDKTEKLLRLAFDATDEEIDELFAEETMAGIPLSYVDSLAKTNPEDLLYYVKIQGKTPDTIALLRHLFPQYDDKKIESFFTDTGSPIAYTTPAGPEAPTEQVEQPLEQGGVQTLQSYGAANAENLFYKENGLTDTDLGIIPNIQPTEEQLQLISDRQEKWKAFIDENPYNQYLIYFPKEQRELIRKLFGEGVSKEELQASGLDVGSYDAGGGFTAYTLGNLRLPLKYKVNLSGENVTISKRSVPAGAMYQGAVGTVQSIFTGHEAGWMPRTPGQTAGMIFNAALWSTPAGAGTATIRALGGTGRLLKLGELVDFVIDPINAARTNPIFREMVEQPERGSLKLTGTGLTKNDVVLKKFTVAGDKEKYKTLQELGNKYGFDVEAIQGIKEDEYWIAVTVKKGEFETVAKWLASNNNENSWLSNRLLKQGKRGVLEANTETFLPFKSLRDAYDFLNTGDKSLVSNTIKMSGESWSPEKLAQTKAKIAEDLSLPDRVKAFENYTKLQQAEIEAIDKEIEKLKKELESIKPKYRERVGNYDFPKYTPEDEIRVNKINDRIKELQNEKPDWTDFVIAPRKDIEKYLNPDALVKVEKPKVKPSKLPRKIKEYHNTVKEIGNRTPTPVEQEQVNKLAKDIAEEFNKIPESKPATTPTPESGVIPKAEAGMPEAKTTLTPEAPTGRAANINLSKFADEVQPEIENWVNKNPDLVDKVRRGTVTFEQTEQNAIDLINKVGGDPAKLAKKVGQAYSDTEIRAISGALTQNIKDINTLRKTLATPEGATVQNQLRLAQLLEKNNILQLEAIASRAEAGRALSSLRMIQEALKSESNPVMERVLKQIGGKDKMQIVTDAMKALDWDNPVEVNNFIRSIIKPSAMDYINEIYVNSILSGPKTQIVNALTNMVNTLMSPFERGTAAVIEKGLAKLQGREAARFLAEVPEDIIGAMQGIPEGLRGFTATMKTGISPTAISKYEYRPSAFKGALGRAVNVPVNMLEAFDNLNYNINFRQAFNAEIFRLGKSKGLKGDELLNFIAETKINPPLEILESASKTAEYRLFRQEGNGIADVLYKFRDWGFEIPKVGKVTPLKFILPFVRTPVNIAKYGLERSPLGFFNPSLIKNLAAKDPKAADQLARAFIGSLFCAGIAWYFGQDKITVAAPTSSGEKDRFYREGKQPYSIKIGDKWYSYQRFEPFNTVFTLVGIAVDAIGRDDSTTTEKIMRAVTAFGKNFISQSYMSGIADMINAIENPGAYGSNILESTAQALLIPYSSLTRTIAQAVDPNYRAPEGFVEQLMSNIPFLSKSVPPKLNVFSEPVLRQTPFWSPVNISKEDNSLINQELNRLGVNIGFVGDAISGVDLTTDQQRQYQELAGKAVKKAVIDLINTPDYKALSDEDKKQAIISASNKAKSQVKIQMIQTGLVGSSPSDITAINSLRDKLGSVTIINDSPYSIDDPIIYNTAKFFSEAVNLAKTIKTDAITDPLAQAALQANDSLSTLNTLPNQSILSLNADPSKGDTYRELYNQWQARLKLDPDAQAAFDADPYTKDAYKGNITARQLNLLDQYYSLVTDSQKAQFLKDHPELTQNPRDEWLKTHPTENALMALFGKGKLLSYAAYKKYQELIVKYDIPNTALADIGISPDEAEIYFKLQGIVDSYSNPALDAQYGALETGQEKDAFKLQYPEWQDDKKRIQIYQDTYNYDHTLPDKKVVEAFVEYSRYDSGSAEAKLIRALNPELDEWLQKYHGANPVNVKSIDALRLTVKNQALQAERDALLSKGDKAEWDLEHPDYVRDQKLIDAYNQGATKEIAELYADWKLLPTEEERDLFLYQNKSLYEFAQSELLEEPFTETEAKVLEIKVKNKDLTAEYKKLVTQKEKNDWLADHPEYIDDQNRIYAYEHGIPENYIESYVEYSQVKTAHPNSYYDERWLQEHPDYYNDVWLNVLDKPEVNFEKVPTEKFEVAYNTVYLKLPDTNAKYAYRRSNAWFNEEGIRLGKFGPLPIKRKTVKTSSKSSKWSH